MKKLYEIAYWIIGHYPPRVFTWFINCQGMAWATEQYPKSLYLRMLHFVIYILDAKISNKKLYHV